MKRQINDRLVNWKNDKQKKPLLITGPRQVGKTYSLLNFVKKEFKNYLKLDLLLNREDYKLFENSINIDDILQKIEILHKFKINEESVLFIDEIQESQQALNFLKSLNEKENIFKHVVASGSWIENTLANKGFTFPVGQVDQITMFPLSFFEFLENTNGTELLSYIKERFENKKQLPEEIHEKIWNIYKNYLFIGGMPYIVNKYINDRKYIISNNINEDKFLLLSQYKNDLTKYATGIHALKINKIFDSIPSNLAKNYNKFTYSSISKNAKAREYEQHILFLAMSRVAIPIYLVNKHETSLKISQNKNIFKLYFSDIGLLCSLSNLLYEDIIRYNFREKGYLIENYVSTQLIKKYHDLSYWREGNDYEVDFLIKNNDGIIPIEVKSGRNKKATSLNQYIKKYSPNYSIVLSQGNFCWSKGKITIPVYATELLI